MFFTGRIKLLGFFVKGYVWILKIYDYEKQVFKNVGGCIIEKELLEAINQQMRELGWLWMERVM